LFKLESGVESKEESIDELDKNDDSYDDEQYDFRLYNSVHEDVKDDDEEKAPVVVLFEPEDDLEKSVYLKRYNSDDENN
jgi:hypothetical protein